MKRRSSIILFALVLLPACTKEPLPVLPEGPQEVRGILQPAEISLVRRGSHLLQVDGVDHAYVESANLNLRLYQGQMVTISGVYEHNAEPTMLPVIVATEVSDVEVTSKEWLLPALGLTLETPNLWQRVSSPGKVHFHLPENEEPVVTLYKLDIPENEDDMPTGVSIIIDGKPAVRQTYEGTGHQIVYITLADDILALEFHPSVVPEDESLRVEWLNLLSSIQFDEKAPTSRPKTGTGTQGGSPCGGPAGILCPDGQYCEVTDVESDIGICRSL